MSLMLFIRPGRENIADALSRLGVENKQSLKRSRKGNVAEEYIRFIATKAAPKAMTAQMIERESAVDAELKYIRECIQTSDWEKGKYSPYKVVREELTCLGKLIMRGTRIVVPETLRKQVLKLAHEGHQGIVKMKARLRTSVWWPGIDKDAEKTCRKCHECQVVGQLPVPDPIQRKKFPDREWQDLAIDILGPLPSGDYLLVVVDYYSRFFEVGIMKTITSTKVINFLEKLFSFLGLPSSIKSDNGSQFTSAEFQGYLEENGIEHLTSTPLWPQANGEVERQNRTLLKCLKIAQVERKIGKVN